MAAVMEGAGSGVKIITADRQPPPGARLAGLWHCPAWKREASHAS